jgi:hypothetical protein
MEAMWMLAGRNDGAFLDNYVKNFSKDFGVNGVILDGYGFRWVSGLGFNQLDEIIFQLRENPGTRQCVLQMWGAGRPDLIADICKPCNLVSTFQIKNGKLDMLMFNRSNDLVWGACGANAVHFAMMQEYVALMIGVEVGEYWQISTNLHLYKNHIDMFYKRVGDHKGKDITHYLQDTSTYGTTLPLIEYPQCFDEELQETMAFIDALHGDNEGYAGNISNSFLLHVVIPMSRAHWKYKHKDFKGAFQVIDTVQATDWQQAGREWMERRIK